MSGKVTSEDVARQAGVSRSVVSAVLNGTPGIRVSAEKRQAVLDAIRELGYRVDAQARGMRTGKSRCIGAYGNLENSLFLQVLQGAQRTCMEAGYQLLLYGRGEQADDGEELLDLYRQKRFDGLITKDTTGYADESFALKVKAAGLPFVSVEGYPEHGDMESVLMDYGQSIELALDYIWDKRGLTPRYIMAYHGDPSRLSWGDRHRLAAYCRWMERKGWTPQVTEIDLDEADELDAWCRLLAGLPRPSALLCNWFLAASRIYRACAGMGLGIGSDLYVMSADNTAQANGYLVPSLSSVEVPYREMGAAAAARVIALAEGRGAQGISWPDGAAVNGEGAAGAGKVAEWAGAAGSTEAGGRKIWLPPRLAPRESM